MLKTGGPLVNRDVTLQRRVRELCAQAVTAGNECELQPILSELRDALREHSARLRAMIAEYPFLPDDIKKPAA